MNPNIENRLRNAIENSGKTIASLAYEYGISLPTIHKALKGETRFQPRVSIALHKIIADYKDAPANV